MPNEPRTPGVPNGLRVFAGFIAQPLIASGVAFLTFPLFLLDHTGRPLAGGEVVADVTAAAGSVAFAVAIVAVIVALVAAPTAMLLAQRRTVGLREALLWGLGFGNTPMLLGAMLAGTYGVEGLARGVEFSSAIGMAGAAVFWVIVLRENSARKP
jgi:hypothetical protein